MSFVWKYFKKIESDEQVECKLCKKKLKFMNSTSSLIKHLSAIHKITDAPSKDQKPLWDFGVTAGRPCNDERQQQITKIVSMMIAEHNLPLHFTEYPGFRKLLAYVEPNYKPVQYETVKQVILEEQNQLKEKLQKELRNAKAIALTTDAWTSLTNESYMAVTCSYISLNFELHSVVLDTILLEDRHVAEYLEDMLSMVIQAWKVEKKIVAVVHDNASNIRNIAKKSNNGEDVGCAAHSLQLAINSAMGTTHAVSNHVIAKLVAKSSKLVGHFNHSSVVNNALKKLQSKAEPDKEPLRLIQYCRTRWNSVYYMFQRLDALRVETVKVLKDQTVSKESAAHEFNLSPSQWDLLSDLLPVLQKLTTANTLLCGEKYVSLSTLYPVLHWLQSKIVFADTDTATIKVFKTDLKEQIKRRFYMPKISVAVITTSLDPRYKTLDIFSVDEKLLAQLEVKKLMKNVAVDMEDMELEDDITGVDDPDVPNQNSEGNDDLADFFAEGPSATSVTSAETEYSR
jgi:hypothetical protein